VGPEGKVVGLDASGPWHEHLERYREERGWRNVELVRAKIADWEGPASGFDLVFVRWVLSFLPEPGRVITGLRRLLAPGGVLAIEDYNHEGVSLFPPSAGFSAAVRATRELYAKHGGDTWIAGSLPRHLRDAGLELFDWKANVLTGGPGSAPFRWADAFFPRHSETMVREGVMLASERELFLAEWEARKKDPNAVFFSPIVVDAAARR
jgi:SAM-dependent methyltransferase